jgi:hypothetical protein
MPRIKLWALLSGCALLATLLWPACSVNVKKEKNGDDKQVDIQSPVGGIHVSQDADAADAGLPVYPGARSSKKDSGRDSDSANVNLSGFGFGLKVVALSYESDDPPEKLVAFYKDQLKKYGNVLVCRTKDLDLDTDLDTSDHASDHASHALTCSSSSGDNTELKVGTKENQHIVAVKRDGKGSSFQLVFVRTHGKQTDI